MILTATAAPPTEHGSVTRTNVTSATHSTVPAKHANVSITLLFYMCFINQTFREFGHFRDTKHQLAACQLASENRHTFPLRQASICLYISFRHLSNMSLSVGRMIVTSWYDDVIVDVRIRLLSRVFPILVSFLLSVCQDVINTDEVVLRRCRKLLLR